MMATRYYQVASSLLLWIALLSSAWAAAPATPAVPTRYFNDYAGIVSAQTAENLNRQLEEFEKNTSSQILVVIYPKLPPNAALEDYTIRAATAWRVGQKAKDNGAILFVFVQDRRMRIEVGYGLEGALPDALANRIIQDEIAPEFRRGDYAAGIKAGVNAMLQATRGEYKGTGSTGNQQTRGQRQFTPVVMFFVFLLLVALSSFGRRRRGTIYSPWGRSSWGGWGGGGGWSSRGGGFSGGGFRGGGGRFGGGGASGSW